METNKLHILTHVAVTCLKLWHLKYKDETVFTVLMYFRTQEERRCWLMMV